MIQSTSKLSLQNDKAEKQQKPVPKETNYNLGTLLAIEYSTGTLLTWPCNFLDIIMTQLHCTWWRVADISEMQHNC